MSRIPVLLGFPDPASVEQLGRVLKERRGVLLSVRRTSYFSMRQRAGSGAAASPHRIIRYRRLHRSSRHQIRRTARASNRFARGLSIVVASLRLRKAAAAGSALVTSARAKASAAGVEV